MKKRMLAGALCLVLTLSASLSLSGCSTAAQAIDLMDGVSAGDVIGDIELTGSEDRAIADFAVQLFKNSGPESKNTLVSPFSVLCALAMTANGAGGDTLAQMQ
ncbi:MAG TPA: serine protease, partial [Clostridiales bacterium]|nr:serine protease [Clostridiales bacterium]HBR08169.1 serine protease [Clostridiales bacterium]